MMPKAQVKSKTDKWVYISLKNLYIPKETINRVKRQSMEWEKIFANHISDKGLISRMQKEVLKCNNKRLKNPIQKRVKNLNRHFSKEDIQIANKHIRH